jgi:Replication protein/Transposase zinc-binding domain
MSQKPLQLPLDSEEIWSEQIWRKTLGLIDTAVSDHLAKCGKEEWYRTCKNCGTVKAFPYRCSMKFCPKCNWRRARERANIIQHWSVLVKQPKHIVLTRRNSSIIERQLLRHTMKSFGKLRRQKEWRNCSGGCVSMEVTNESRGWHVHLHILADIRWMPAGILSQRWAELMGQDFAIVKVTDAREHTYRQEVAKYVVKASHMAAWPAEEIAAFIGAIKGVKFFAPFGSLYKLQRSIKTQIEMEKPIPEPCECGCDQYFYDTEKTEILRLARRKER